MEFQHKSVLLSQCLEALSVKPDGIYLDGTLGGAGHSSQIAKRLTTGRLIGVDRDEIALCAARQRLAPYMDRVTLVHANFQDLDRILQDLGIPAVDGILLGAALRESCSNFSSSEASSICARSSWASFW